MAETNYLITGCHGGEVWLVPSPDQSIEVKFDGEIEKFEKISTYFTIRIIQQCCCSSLYVSGYDSKGVSKLRLWAAKTIL